MKDNFAIFRYPDSKDIHLIQCETNDLGLSDSYTSVGKEEGFIFAPFSISEASPVILIKGKSEKISLKDLKIKDSIHNRIIKQKDDKTLYANDFKSCQALISTGMADKIVLSRKSSVITDTDVSPLALFKSACMNNPNSFVALIRTGITGTWLMATPEILLECSDNVYHTIALAGTMPINKQGEYIKWSNKNKNEQQYVADYIRNILKKYTQDIIEKGPYTYNSGNIIHLRSDFSFYLDNRKICIGDIVTELHPTPAVCGLPTDSCKLFILEKESCHRGYYSGFCGIINNEADFRLYVTLRCMKINNKEFILYAGGGILPDSNLDEEWNETICKMQAMKNCITNIPRNV